MREVRLAPSDIAYLFRECSRCWWLKTRHLAPLKEPFPGIFNDIDKGMKDSNRPRREGGPCLLDAIRHLGLPVKSQIEFGFIKSAPFEYPEFDVQIIICGKLDSAYELDDGSVAIVDFKTTKPQDYKILKFQDQLHSYQACLEYPHQGEGMQVDHLGLLCFVAGPMVVEEIKEGAYPRSAIIGKLDYLTIEVDRARFKREILDVAAEMAGSDRMPPASSNCPRCYSVAETIDYLNRYQGAA